MSYKDEYEVARLHADPAFIASIRSQFEGDWTLKFHLAPPIFSRLDPKTGVPAKRQFGSWILSAMRLLAKLKFARGKWFDPFGRTLERRARPCRRSPMTPQRPSSEKSPGPRAPPATILRKTVRNRPDAPN
jgi:hypothetical protein